MSGEDNPHFSPFGTTEPGAPRPAALAFAAAAYLRNHPQVEAMFDEPTAKTLAQITAPSSGRRASESRGGLLASLADRP